MRRRETEKRYGGREGCREWDTNKDNNEGRKERGE